MKLNTFFINLTARLFIVIFILFAAIVCYGAEAADDLTVNIDADPFANDDSGFSEADFFRLEEEIVQIASRKKQKISQAPSIVSVLTASDLKYLGIQNLAEALNLLPGVVTRYTKSGAYELIMRGQKEAPDILVMIDGQRLNSMYDGSVLYDMNISNVKRIEVIRGPGSALYGTNAFSGVISITTFSSYDKNRFAASSTMFPQSSSFHVDNSFAYNLYMQNQYKVSDWQISSYAGWINSQGALMEMPLDFYGEFNEDNKVYPWHRDENEDILADNKLKFELHLAAKKESLIIDGDMFRFEPKIFYRSQGPNFGFAESLNEHSKINRNLIIIPFLYTFNLNESIKVKTRISYDLQQSDEDIQIRKNGYYQRSQSPIPAPNGLRNKTEYSVHNYSIEPQALIEVPDTFLWEQHSMILGFLFEHGYMSDFKYSQNYYDAGFLEYYESFYEARIKQLENEGIKTSGFQNYNNLSLRQKNADRYQLSFYLQDQFALPQNSIGEIWFTGGFRVDRFSDARVGDKKNDITRKTFSPFNPRGTLTFSPSFGGFVDGLTLKVLYSTAFRAPTFQELYDSTKRITEKFHLAPNELLKPQTTKVYEFGLDFAPVKFLGNLFNFFNNNYDYADVANSAVFRFNFFLMDTFGNLALERAYNLSGNQVINYPQKEVKGYELEMILRYSKADFLFISYSKIRAWQLKDCIREGMAGGGECDSDHVIIDRDLTELPKKSTSAGLSIRPLGTPMELLDLKGGVYNIVSPLTMTFQYFQVGATENNKRTAFESNSYKFYHSGYSYFNYGFTYRLFILKQDLLFSGFIYNIFDDDVSEPLMITKKDVTLPRPGRYFLLSIIFDYSL